MSSHTKGPWEIQTRVQKEPNNSWRVWIGPAGDVSSAEVHGFFSEEECVANAARIVACVNACEGIENPAAALSTVRTLLLQPSATLDDFNFVRKQALAALGVK